MKAGDIYLTPTKRAFMVVYAHPKEGEYRYVWLKDSYGTQNIPSRPEEEWGFCLQFNGSGLNGLESMIKHSTFVCNLDGNWLQEKIKEHLSRDN
jgi:hypothetical protein